MGVTKLNLPVSVERDEDGFYVAVCQALPVASQGNSKEEAINHVIEALELFVNDEDVQKQYHDELEKYSVNKDKSFVKVEVNGRSKKASRAVGI